MIISALKATALTLLTKNATGLPEDVSNLLITCSLVTKTIRGRKDTEPFCKETSQSLTHLSRQCTYGTNWAWYKNV